MEEKKIGFRLSKVNWIAALIFIGISALFFLKRDGVNGYSLGYLLGSIVTSAILPLLIAYIVWQLKRKKLYAGTYTFNIVLVIMCLGMIKKIGVIDKEKTNKIDAISKSEAEYKEKVKNKGDDKNAFKELCSNVDSEISQMIRNSTGKEQEVYKNFQEFTSINNSVMIDWQKSFDSVAQARILDYSVLNNQAEFEYQIGIINYYKNQSILYKNHFENRKSLFASLNKNIPNENLTLQGVMSGLNKKDSIQKPTFDLFIKSHIDYSKNLLEIIELLQINQGKWEYKNEKLIFSSLELEEEFSSLINKIEEEENKINELSTRLIEVM